MSKQFKRILVKQGNTWTFAYCVCKNESSNSKSKGEKNKKITVKQCKKENKITVKEYLIAWFEHHKNFIEPATANGYHVNIFNHIIPEIGDNQLSDLDVNDIENMCLNLKKNKNLSAKTIKYVYNVLKVALNKAVENNTNISKTKSNKTTTTSNTKKTTTQKQETTRSNTNTQTKRKTQTTQSSTSSTSEGGYIVNKNSHVFHKPNCPSVKRMNESNKIYSSKSRAELINEGCKSCNNCNS